MIDPTTGKEMSAGMGYDPSQGHEPGGIMGYDNSAPPWLANGGAPMTSNTQTPMSGGFPNGQAPSFPQQGGMPTPQTPQFPNFTGRLDPSIQALVSQTYQPMVGDIVSQSIDAARQRGFSGGADLLRTAANPMASQMLANLPGQEANSQLQMMLGIPQLQSNIASQQAGAQSSLMNAATGQYGAESNRGLGLLGQGTNQYGAETNRGLGLLGADTNQYNAQTNAANTALTAGNNQVNSLINLLRSLPTGTATQGVTGDNTNLSDQSGTNASGAGTSQQANPLGNVIGQGVNQSLLGALLGYQNMQPSQGLAGLLQNLLGGGGNLSGQGA